MVASRVSSNKESFIKFEVDRRIKAMRSTYSYVGYAKTA